MSALIDIAGQKFGRWTAVRHVHGGSLWACICECGIERKVSGVALRNGKSLSCGCITREVNTRHGHAKKRNRSPTYQCWYAMIQRATNPKNRQWKDYGARGITVCDEWRNFEAFLVDMGERPEGMSLERTDNSKGYEKSNCRWATRAEQQRNRRNNRWFTINGETKCVADWARESGLYPALVRNRVVDRGWSIERALSTPPIKARAA